MDNLLLNKAIELATYKIDFEEENKFLGIYPFTTENIGGYIDMFDLKDKSLLTVGSSGDQVINAAMRGCNNQTVIDICPFAKYYFYLKKAALLSLGYEHFFSFLSLNGYPKYTQRRNSNVFNLEKFPEILPILKGLNKESYEFWKALIQKIELYNKNHNSILNRDTVNIRIGMFHNNFDVNYVLKKMNLYLQNEENFNIAKKAVENLDPIFITANIYDTDIKQKYDNIFLSNMFTYYELEDNKKLFDKLSKENLSCNGKMLIYYFCYTHNNEFILDKRTGNYKDCMTSYYNITGRDGIRFACDIKDTVLIYEKKSSKK